jgi:threonine/homoserine/homoserine lactone efflux protein
LLEIVLVAFISVASIGPTHILAIIEGLKKGFWVFFGILIGGVIVDVFYANLAFLGFSAFGGYSVFKLIALPVGASVFAFMSCSQIRAFFLKDETSSKNDKIIVSPFFTGVVMTLPNPFALIMWATLFSSSKIQVSCLAVTSMILIVGLVWIIFEGILISIFKKHINSYFLRAVEIFTAILLLYFACKFGYEFITSIMQL